ncbi:MAG: capsular polysaccharide biosynthesis protein [Desulfovibrio sp.]|nr:capsular polysaccharide biosynthesis protein [Desulfovibrio sp.]
MGRLFRYGIRMIRWRMAHYLPSLPSWLFYLFGRPFPPSSYLCFSKGIDRIPHLAVFVEKPVVYLPPSFLAHIIWARKEHSCAGVLFWGMKETLPKPSFSTLFTSFANTPRILAFAKACFRYIATRAYAARLRFAQSFAKTHALPILRLEDGFLRSLDLGVRGASPLSLVLDKSGMYYDATQPSDLETLLASDWEPSEEEKSVAQKALATLKTFCLSKYNHAPLVSPSVRDGLDKNRVLLLDQTAGDVSIHCGLASEESFVRMLHEARNAHPTATLYVKTHPDVVSGKKNGLLPRRLLDAHCVLIDWDVAPLSLLSLFDEVYTVTSQMGFEALLLGKKVHCFGLPFYAGWGVTIDSLSSPRRSKKRSFLAIFIAAYMRYARYLSVGLDQRGSLDSCLTLLSTQRAINEQNRGFHACIGFHLWKREHARAFLSSTGGDVAFYNDVQHAIFAAKRKNGSLVLWSSKETAMIEPLCRENHVPLLRMEDGFLRSVGLGSDFFRPGSLVLDDLGIYYDPSRPSRLETILAEERSDEELRAAKKLAYELVARGISKYNVSGKNDLPPLPTDQKIVLVPGQVEDDASVRLGGLGIHSNTALLEAVRAANKDAFILYKEHPDVVSGNRLGKIADATLARLADGCVRTCPIECVLPLCHEVHTLTSLTGFEALLRSIPVVTYGGPFYAGWGLTRDRAAFPRRFRLPSLWHLVAGTLLLYPRYYDWEMGMFVPCQAFIERLAKIRSSGYNF